jgi:outer membrane immunogenic protein
MKRLLLAGFAVGALIAPAVAADAPPAPAPYYPAPLPPVVWSWTGFYIGANLGWAGSSQDNLTNTGTDTGTGGLGTALRLGYIPPLVGLSHSGFIGGGQIGYNWQAANWVWGIEADFDGITNGSSTSAFPNTGGLFGPFTTTFTGGLDSLGTVRGRVGLLSSPSLLWYATLGLAYGETKVGSAFVNRNLAPPASVALTSSNLSTGWTIGAGVEWRFAPAWSVKAEYLYVDLGSQSEIIGYAYGPFNSTLTSTVNERDNIVRAGLNYKFW